MEVTVLNKNFESVDVIDYFESLIWTDRFNKCGDFEIYTPITTEIWNILQPDYYLWSRDSEYLMIIEDRQIETDIETGNHVTITGRSLESILMRRIIWNQTVITGNLQTGIKKLITENVINPGVADRKIANFIFEDSTDEAITKLTIESAQYTGDVLYDVITELCATFSIGFKITLNDSKQFVFKLYSGTDRSYSQSINPYVVFSPNFENIMNSKYLESSKTLKNVTLVAGEGEGSARRTSVLGSGTGIERRELYTDARDISSNVDGGTLSDAEYMAQLKQRGTENMADYKVTKTFEGEVEATQMFSYGEDFFLGDIVQNVNEYGMEFKSRVEEIVRSQNEEGNSIYPGFTIIEDKEEEES